MGFLGFFGKKSTEEQQALETGLSKTKVGLFENKYLVGAFLLGTVLQLGIVFVPTLAEIFKLTQLNTTQWLITIAISIAPIIIVEIQKKFNELKFGKVVYDYKTRQEV